MSKALYSIYNNILLNILIVYFADNQKATVINLTVILYITDK